MLSYPLIYSMPFFEAFNPFIFKVIIDRYLLIAIFSYLCSSLSHCFSSCHLLGKFVSSPSLSGYVGLLFWGGSLVGRTCVGHDLLSIQLLYLFFFGTFNPFMFKVIIDRYLFTANFSYQCPSDSLPFPSFPESSPFIISCSAGLVETYSFFFFSCFLPL